MPDMYIRNQIKYWKKKQLKEIKTSTGCCVFLNNVTKMLHLLLKSLSPPEKDFFLVISDNTFKDL